MLLVGSTEVASVAMLLVSPIKVPEAVLLVALYPQVFKLLPVITTGLAGVPVEASI